MNKLHIIFNICGISNKNNNAHYMESLEGLAKQDMDDYHIIVSSCMNKPEHLTELMNNFPDASFNIIKEVLPVNVTFNHSVQQAIYRLGKAEGYLYIDSGCRFPDNTAVRRLYELFKSGPYAMASSQTDTDTGYLGWFGFDRPPADSDFIVPVGKACNLHVQIFSHELYEAYDKRLMPDIFASFCTESTFSFLCAAIRRNWVISRDIILPHSHSMDGASSGFGHGGWTHLFRSPRSIFDIISDRVGIDAGFGYEECQRILMHNPACFDEKGFCKNDKLKEFMRNNIFLPKSALDYSKIKHEFII